MSHSHHERTGCSKLKTQGLVIWLKLSISSSSADRLASLLSIQRKKDSTLEILSRAHRERAGILPYLPYLGQSWACCALAWCTNIGPQYYGLSHACAMVALRWLSTSSWSLGPTVSTNASPSWALLWVQPHLASQELALALITCFVRSCLDHLVFVRARCVRCD